MSYSLTIFLSAFLLFQIQLVVGKFLLPWFGGTPAVWATCMMFFQTALLVGYAFAHRGVAVHPPLRFKRLYVGFLFVSLAAPITTTVLGGQPFLVETMARWTSTTDTPITSILIFLSTTIGLPFVMLSATSPLLQRWYADAGSPNPYRLYAVSNAGSVLGLVTYPFLVEPFLDINRQIWLWTGAYLVFIITATICARWPSGQRTTEIEEPAATPEARPTAARQTLWLLIPTATCALLLSVTSELCQEIAVVPFLWVVPLVLYLLSFIICFDNPRWYSRRIFTLLAIVITLATLAINTRGPGLPIAYHLVSLNALIFIMCMVGHGELVRLRPAPRHLTAFYLTVAAGGAIGGMLVALVAPVVLPDFWEFHIALCCLWVLVTVLLVRDRQSFVFRGDPLLASAALFILLYLLFHFLLPPPPHHARIIRLAICGALVATAAGLDKKKKRFLCSRQWPRLLLAIVLLATEAGMLHRVRDGDRRAITTIRNFFGVVKVWDRHENDPARHMRVLTHGRIAHGMQFHSPETRRRPVAYYAEGSGIWCAMEYHPRLQAPAPPPSLRIGVTGLGAGGLAPYAQKGDLIRFYEINPAVVDIAGNDFSYLADCRGTVELVEGDARLNLDRELAAGKPGRFDILVLDAFTSDAVPVHLLTLEAFEIYMQHLRDDHAIVAVNISNRFVNFLPLMKGIATHLKVKSAWIRASAEPPYRVPSSWYLMSRDDSFFAHPDVAGHVRPVPDGETVVWTDAFSNLARLLTARK